MNVIVCRHPGDNGKYLFMVPADVTLDAGCLLKVETVRGEQPAQAITSSFNADPEIVCPLWGTKPGNMKRVLSYLHESRLEWPEEQDRQEQAFVDDEE